MNNAAWRLVGGSGLTFGIVCLAGLAAALALEGDALATSALVLAIIAFVVQIVVFVLQLGASQGVADRSEAIYTDTSNVLREIKAKAESNEAVLVSQSDRLLNALITLLQQRGFNGPAAPVTPDESDVDEETNESSEPRVAPPPPADTAAIAQMVLDQLRLGGPTTPRPRRDDAREQMRSWPTVEEARQLVQYLSDLSPLAVALLERYASAQDRHGVGRLRTAGSPGREPERAELLQRGLLSEPEPGFAQLTDLGREVARLLRARGEPPPEIKEMLDEIRKR